MSAHKIIEGIKDAIAGNVSRVHIDGQSWERVKRSLDDPPAEQEVAHLAEQCSTLLRENERQAAEIERLLAALKIAHEGLELASDMIHDMVSRGHIIGDNCTGPGYFVGSGVLPKIAEAREAARRAHEQSQRD